MPPEAGNTSPLADCLPRWEAELRAVHARTCKAKGCCAGPRAWQEVCREAEYRPDIGGPAATARCTQAIEAEELLHIVRHGAEILPRGKRLADVPPFEVHNYPATPEGAAATLADIESELARGVLIEVTHKPQYLTALSVKQEAAGKVRVLRDCSAPEGNAANDHVDALHYTMMDVRDAQAAMRPRRWMAKVDIKAAFRTVGVRPDQRGLLGFKFRPPEGGRDRYFVDTRLPFGLKNSSEIFCRLSTAVRAMMVTRGYESVVVYVDDFLIIEDAQERCAQALQALLELLGGLGFTVSPHKTVQPTHELTFLGYMLRTNEGDAGAMSISVPQEKLRKAQATARELADQRQISLKAAQSALGYFNHLAMAVYAARCFMRRIMDAVTEAERQGRRHITVTRDIQMDLRFWIHFAGQYNGKSVVLEHPRMVRGLLSTDASDWGMGGFFNGLWFSVKWSQLSAARVHRSNRALNKPDLWPDCQDKRNGRWGIEYREQFALWWALLLWSPLLRDKTATWSNDNSVTVANMRRMGASNPNFMKLLRQIYKLSAMQNVRHVMRQVTSAENYLADLASRGQHAEFGRRRAEWLAADGAAAENRWIPPEQRDPPLMEQRAQRWLASGTSEAAAQQTEM